MSLRERIERIYQHAPHPLGALWAWAKRGGAKAGDRWQALQNWAGDRLRGGNKSADFEKARDAYQAKKQKWLHSHKDPKPPSGELLTTYDGHQVPVWMVQQALAPARASGEWKGLVYSGYRSPEYSRQLCENMCGAPSCPGRCAGASSNHSCPPTHTGKAYEGAVDVTDPAGLQRWCASHGYPIRHTLPSDLNHFSRTGS